MKNPKQSKVAFPELRSMLWILAGMLTILLFGLGACFLFTFYDYKGVIMIISIMLLFAAILWYQIKRASSMCCLMSRGSSLIDRGEKSVI